MKSVINNEHTIIIKNSKFISCIYYINEQQDIDKFLKQIKEIYPNATHYCYAYIFDGQQKESDDGEPSGTAGLPILQVLEKNGLNRVLCIVVRYFGKIKLGAGGLVRAYTRSVVECLEGNIVNLEKGYLCEVKFSYDNLKKVDYLLRNSKINNKEFDTQIIYHVLLKEDLLLELKGLDNIFITIIQNVYF